jgi:hypothetical protein
MRVTRMGVGVARELALARDDFGRRWTERRGIPQGGSSDPPFAGVEMHFTGYR